MNEQKKQPQNPGKKHHKTSTKPKQVKMKEDVYRNSETQCHCIRTFILYDY